MITSLHVVRFRRARLSQSRSGANPVPGLKLWLPLSTGAQWRPPKPDFHQWAFLGIWEEDDALDQFLHASPIVNKWEERGDEVWHVRLIPTSSRGSWRGTNPFAGPRPPDVPKDPVAVITLVRIKRRKLPTFWVSAQKGPALDLKRASGLLADLPTFAKVPFVDLLTFTLWRSTDDAMNYAYRRSPHNDAVRRSRSEGIFRDQLFARFYPYRSAGTWRGQDPLAQARLAGPSP